MVIAVEHLLGWSFTIYTTYSTADIVAEFLKSESIHPLRNPRTIVSYRANCFTAGILQTVMEYYAIKWKKVLGCAHVFNGKAERMVGVIKRAISKLDLSKNDSWDEALCNVLSVYRRRRGAHGFSPCELMLGQRPWMKQLDQTKKVEGSDEEDRYFEPIATSSWRVKRAEKEREPTYLPKAKIVTNAKGVTFFLARRDAVSRISKTPP